MPTVTEGDQVAVQSDKSKECVPDSESQEKEQPIEHVPQADVTAE
jgi:hypothetical protein